MFGVSNVAPTELILQTKQQIHLNQLLFHNCMRVSMNWPDILNFY